MSSEKYRAPVNWILVQYDFEDVDDILLAEFERVFRFGGYTGSLFGRSLRLAKDSRQSERRAICSQRAVAERRYNDVTVLLGETHDLLIVRVHVAVLIGTTTVEHHNERHPGLTVPDSRNVQAIRHSL